MQKLFAQAYCRDLELKREDKTWRGELCAVSLSLAALRECAMDFLHPKELSYFSTLEFERRQHSYLLSRLTAKHALIQYGVKGGYTEILIEPGVFQFPVVFNPKGEKIQISDSHCNTYCIAIAYPEEHPMGIDLEMIDARNKIAIETQLTNEEIELIKSLNDSNLEKIYTLLWTMKESLSKILLTGLTSPFKIFEVKNLKQVDNHWTCEYKNFTQYHALSFLLGEYICTIAYPRHTQINFDIPSIQTWFKRHI